MSTGLDVFDTTLQKTNELLESVEKEFGWEGRRHQSYQAVRAVLHAIRDRLDIDESVQLASQLPILLKGVYFDGWNPAIVPVKLSREEFIQYVRANFIFDIDIDIEQFIRLVAGKIFAIIDPGEVGDIVDNLPAEIVDLLV